MQFNAQGHYITELPTAPVELLLQVALDASQVFMNVTLYCWRRICMLSRPFLGLKKQKKSVIKINKLAVMHTIYIVGVWCL